MKYKVYQIIIGISLLIIIIGGIMMLNNLPKKFDVSESKMTFLGRDDLGNMLNLNFENSDRKEKRQSATTILILGGVIFFVGLFMKSSENEPLISSGKPFTDAHTDQDDYCYCANCGARIRKGNKCKNCN